MITIFFRTLRDKKITLLIYCVSALLVAWMYIALFPSMKGMSEDFMKLLDGYPDAFLSMFPISEASFVNLENFLAMENYSFMVPIMLLFLISSIAGLSIAGEIEKGTAEIILARPVSRIKIFFGRYFAGIFGLALFTLSATVLLPPIAAIYGIHYVFANYVTIFCITMLFGWATFSLAMLLSAIFSEKSKVYMTLGGIYISMYVIQIISGLSEKWSDTKYFSFFYYYDYEAAIVSNSIDWINISVFSVFAILATLIAAYYFKRRDITI
ncbi:MAG: ABC transporter permease subunit [Patescibacteria group bacterium]|jgi:ABC-2 type transport system permease protein